MRSLEPPFFEGKIMDSEFDYYYISYRTDSGGRYTDSSYIEPGWVITPEEPAAWLVEVRGLG